MAVKFIHTGDWHLGKPYGRFEPDKQALLREARTRIPERVGTLARRLEAQVVLVAGDIFDSPWVGDDVLRKLAARLVQFTDIQWHFLPGNHDPSTPNGVWRRFAAHAGDHVVIHHEAALVQISEQVDLLVAPLTTKAVSHDPTVWMDQRQSKPGKIRLGLAHGAVRGFGSSGEATVPIAPDRADRGQLDYLALGDWHGVSQVNAHTWYAGTPEPDHFPDNDPGYVLSVEIERAGAPPVVQQHKTAQYKWQSFAIDQDADRKLSALLNELEQDAEASNTLLQVVLSGAVTIDDELQLRDKVSRLTDLVFDVQSDFSRLTITTGRDTSDLFEDPMLNQIASRLAAAIAAGETEATTSEQSAPAQSATAHPVTVEPRVARQALSLLTEFAHRRGPLNAS